MKLLTTVLLVVLLTACESQTNDVAPEAEQAATPQVTKTTEPSTSATNTAHAGHQQNARPANGYHQLEVKEACEQPTVTYFFAYQCPHCYQLESHTLAWLKTKSDQVKFRMVPTDLGSQQFGPFLLVHHAAEKLGVIDQVKATLFNRIHEQQKLIESIEQAQQILVDAGVDPQTAEQALKDEKTLVTALRADYETSVSYKITGVPAVLVNYKYKTSPGDANGYDQVFKVVEEALKLPSECSSFGEA